MLQGVDFYVFAWDFDIDPVPGLLLGLLLRLLLCLLNRRFGLRLVSFHLFETI